MVITAVFKELPLLSMPTQGAYTVSLSASTRLSYAAFGNRICIPARVSQYPLVNFN